MKRRALLIGNTFDLGGVTADMNAWKHFLRSEHGGCWYDNEIITKTDMSCSDLRALLRETKDEQNDFVIVVFSGHGGIRREQVLYPNSSNETIMEYELKGLAPRQITELDCCRVYETALECRRTLFSEGGVITESVSRSTLIRKEYERRIMQACEQQVTLYACSIGESAYDNGQYGYFTHELLSVAQDVTEYNYKTISDVMPVAAARTTDKVRLYESAEQHPQVSKPRCHSSQDLILSINPIMGMLGS